MRAYEVCSVVGYCGDFSMTAAELSRWLRLKREGACRSSDVDFYSGDPGPALEVCRGCRVQAKCLEHALDLFEVGVWGGMTQEQRAALVLGEL
jgi:Transcription factor WhiB